MATSEHGADDEQTPDDVYPGIQAERVQTLNDDDVREGGEYVLYWMQQSHRSELNHALEYAIRRANELELPVLTCFGLTDGYPEANLRHYHFLLQGLADVAGSLASRHVGFVLRRGEPDEVAVELAGRAALVVCDRGYLRPQRRWRERVAKDAGCAVVQVESDVVVPVELVSEKKESAARTIRPKITRHLERFLVELPKARVTVTSPPDLDGESLDDLDALLEKLDIDRSVPPVPLFTGGTTAGRKVLEDFCEHRLGTYSQHRNQPQTDDVSHMSKYLHYGQLSVIEIALTAKEAGGGENLDDFLEELIVRRELPMNYVFYEPDYDRFSAIPEWAKQTLAEHADDERSPQYTDTQLEAAATEDAYWNAAMKELKHTGYMHNYMRMYWGKKILEWSPSPEKAYRTTLALNNRYFLDGRDANSFAGVAWLFGVHDRGWTERDVYGKVRSMTAGGLERKAKPEQYVEKVERLVAEVGGDDAGGQDG